MSIEIATGFDNFDHTIIAFTGGPFDNWVKEAETDIEISQSYGRNGRAGIRLATMDNSAGQRASFTKHFTSDLEGIIVGAAVRVDSGNSGIATIEGQGRTIPVFTFHDGANYQCSVVISPSMRIIVKNGGPATGSTIGRSDYYLHENTFHYIEADVTISNTGGSVTIYVDGIVRLTLTNVDTQTTTNAYLNGVRFGFSGNGNSGQGRHMRFDDLYIVSKVTGVTHRLGDIVVDGLLPTSDYVAGWTRSSAGTNSYQNIDDSVPDGALTYNYTTTVGQYDLYGMDAHHYTSNGTVWGVASNIYAQKNDAGIIRIAPVYATSGTLGVEGDEMYLNQTYRYHSDLQESNPQTSTRWTSVPSTKFGYRRK